MGSTGAYTVCLKNEFDSERHHTWRPALMYAVDARVSYVASSLSASERQVQLTLNLLSKLGDDKSFRFCA